MGSVADKIKGNANEAMGKAKQGVGEATGSDRLQGEGAVLTPRKLPRMPSTRRPTRPTGSSDSKS